MEKNRCYNRKWGETVKGIISVSWDWGQQCDEPKDAPTQNTEDWRKTEGKREGAKGGGTRDENTRKKGRYKRRTRRQVKQ